MRWKPHVRFGGRGREDLRAQRPERRPVPDPYWEDGGPTDTCNLISLCAHHHRLHHRGRLGIEGDGDDPDGVVFTDDRGSRLEGCGRPAPPGDKPPPPGNWAPPSGERLEPWPIYFNEPGKTLSPSAQTSAEPSASCGSR